MFPTDKVSFPFKENLTFVASCSVSPMHSKTLAEIQQYITAQALGGTTLFRKYPDTIRRVDAAAAKLFHTSTENVSFIGNTAIGMSIIANGYPFQPGDEIISYCHEYPSNFYPWKIQENRGAILKLVPDSSSGSFALGGRPFGFKIEELEKLITPRTKVVALSHVQFHSGFAVDLKILGALCRDRGIDLIIDAAQSLGSLPVYPDEFGIAAVTASGWKWLLGPNGSGLLFTSPALREKIRLTILGPESMKQGLDYLDLNWNPHQSGRAFEYSTPPMALAHGLAVSLEELFSKFAVEEIQSKVFSLIDLFIERLDRRAATPILHEPANRSGILSLITERDPITLANELFADGFVFSARAGYLRFAPHAYCTEEEVVAAAEALNRRL
jgi:cysteine desulfurase/selenocysteine lyase